MATAEISAQNATGVRRICGYHGFVLLGLLPFLNMMGMGYAYAALPLHFLDMGWSLPALGAVAAGWKCVARRGDVQCDRHVR